MLKTQSIGEALTSLAAEVVALNERLDEIEARLAAVEAPKPKSFFGLRR